MQKVTIADPNNSFSVLLAGALRTEYLVEVYGEGACLIEHLRRFRPDVLVGGFHLKDMEPGCEEIEKIGRMLAAYDTVYYTGHCTGDGQFRQMKQILGDRLQSICSGRVFEV